MRDFVGMMRNKAAVWKEALPAYQCMAKPCMILFAVYTVGMFSILRADFNYRDDLRRIMTGKQGWGSSYGRYLSDFFSLLIHTDSYMEDISPLTQLIAVAIMAASAGILWYLMSERKKFSVWDVAALIPLGLCPYFLACMSYKFDAPYMAMSVFASIIPLLFQKKGYLPYAAAVFLGNLAMCATYQAASGIFPMLVILIFFKNWNNQEDQKENFKFAGISVIGYLAGLLVYKVFLMPARETYVSNALPPLKDLIPNTFRNLAQYYAHIKNEFKIEWLLFIFLMCVAFVFVTVRDSKRKKLAAFFGSGAALVFMLLLAFGMYPVLSKPLYHPRGMYGFGVFLALVGIVISTSKKVYPAKLVCAALAWCFFVFSFLYGNTLKIQDDYINYRTIAVLEDLKDLDLMLEDGKVTIQVDGNIGYAPAVRRLPKEYKMLERLLPRAYKDGKWSLNKFRYFGLSAKKNNWNWQGTEDFSTYDLPVLKDTIFHTIKGRDDRILVEMK